MESAKVWIQNAIDVVMNSTAKINGDNTVLLTATTTTASIFIAYLCTVRYYRYKNLNLIRARYPNPNDILHDAEAANFIYATITGKEFPFLSRLSLEFAFFKTFTVPTISKILAANGEFSRDIPSVVRRADDTELLLRELNEIYGRVENQLEKNPNTPKEDIMAQAQRSTDAMQRLNELHGKYRILNGDFLYTLTLFVFEPISFINRFEWRQLDEREINAIYKVWYDIGKRMNIEGIPDTVEGLLKFKEEYGSSHIEYHPSNWKVGEPTVRLLLTQFPNFLREPMYPLAVRTLPSILASYDAEAFRLPKENKLITGLVRASLKLRALFTRYLLLPRSSYFVRTPFYPNNQGRYVPNHFHYSPSPYYEGYKIEEFGPVKFLKKNSTTTAAVAPPLEHPPISDDLSDIMPKCPMMH